MDRGGIPNVKIRSDSMIMKCRVPGETYEEYTKRPGRSSLTWAQEREWKDKEKNSNPPITGSSVQESKNKNNITITVSVDTTELDKALEKAKELERIIDKVNKGPIIDITIDGENIHKCMREEQDKCNRRMEDVI